MKPVIAVFDIGKTNKKFLLFDSSFKVVYQKEEKFPCVQDDDGFKPWLPGIYFPMLMFKI